MRHSEPTLDARGLNCPLPILHTRKTLVAIPNGGVLAISASDPGSVKDIESFCAETGNTLLSSTQQGTEFLFRVRKA